MNYTIKKVDYFYTTIKDQPGEAYKLLNSLGDLGLNLLAFTAVPIGPISTQLALFPENIEKFKLEAQNAHMSLDGPHHALLVRGDANLEALTDLHLQLFKANINVYAASGVADGKGNFGYVLYIKPEDFDRAIAALEL